jgi:transcriptional regulator with XRE-family HTH domain
LVNLLLQTNKLNLYKTNKIYNLTTKNMQQNENQRLKILRVTKNLSQKEVADALDMTQAGYSALEKGKISLSRTHLQLLKDKLDLDISYILEGNEDVNSTTAPQWAQDLMRKIDKLIDLQTSQQGKMIELLGKHSGKPLTAMQTYLKVA